jgi:hypothetical protein
MNTETRSFFRDLTNPDNNHLKKMSGRETVLDILNYIVTQSEEVKS